MSLAPGAVLGIVGGGQLGRMTAMAAARLGLRCHILTPEAGAPAAQVSAAATVAAYDDPAALDAFAAAVDVVTIEFENLPVPALERIAATCPVHPAPSVLAICQDRLLEKGFLQDLGVPVTAFAPVPTAAALDEARAALGRRPAILKTARFGYDGKGQARVRPEDPAPAVRAALGAGPGVFPAILEAEVDFEREISVVLARTADGEVASYPPVENQHRDHILARTLAPAPIPDALAAEARALAARIADALRLVGVLAVEMFVTSDGRILVNELAPRPHNSGHWTLDACATSQFEQLVRAAAGWPLGDPAPFATAVMDNLLGPEVERWPALLAEPGARLHLYGKDEIRPGRKLGHVTRLGPLRPAGT